MIHGGLGTTAEAIKAGKPCIVTGVLLMDQRFWGQRVYEMGVGPPPLSIRSFAKSCSKLVAEALSDGSAWAKTAAEKKRELMEEEAARLMRPATSNSASAGAGASAGGSADRHEDSGDGVQANVEKLLAAIESAPPWSQPMRGDAEASRADAAADGIARIAVSESEWAQL